MKKEMFLSSIILSVAMSAFAQTAPTTSATANNNPGQFSLNLDGTNGNFRWRDQHDNKGKETFDQAMYAVDMKVTFQLTEDGKLKLKSRVQTGNGKFDGDSENLGIGNNTHTQKDLFVKQLYLDYTISKSASAQLGAIPVLPSGIVGALNIDGDGWVDGARMNFLVSDHSWIKQVNVTVGEVDEYTTPNALERKVSKPNFVQVHIRGNLAKIAGYTLEATNFHDEQFLRGILDIAMKDIVGFVDKIVIEEMISSKDSAQKGFAVSLSKTLKDVGLTLQYTDKSAYISQTGPKFLALEDYYRPGKQVTFKIERNMHGGTIFPFFRISKTLNDPKLGAIQFNSNKGVRAEAGFRWVLPKKYNLIFKRN